jgi:hypothetical protein
VPTESLFSSITLSYSEALKLALVLEGLTADEDEVYCTQPCRLGVRVGGIALRSPPQLGGFELRAAAPGSKSSGGGMEQPGIAKAGFSALRYRQCGTRFAGRGNFADK